MRQKWKDVVGYEGLYKVSNFGVVKNSKNKILKQSMNSNGYLKLSLSKNNVEKNKYIHRLVCSSFYGDSTLEVNHINGIKTDNRLENLEWVTKSQNAQHANKLGLREPQKLSFLKLNNTQKGENSTAAKLTKHQVDEIRLLLDLGETQQKIADKFRVSRSNISHIKSGRNWDNYTYYKGLVKK